MLRIAIFNDDTHHYNEFDYIISWCNLRQHTLTIYGMDQYKSENSRSIDKFQSECHNYHLIFTTASGKNKFIHLYDLERTMIVIDKITFDRDLTVLDNKVRTIFPEYYQHPPCISQVKMPTMGYNEVVSTAAKEPSALSPGVTRSLWESSIPKILHVMWLSPNNDPVPAKYLPNIEQYRLYNPEYELRIWNMEQAQRFLQEVNLKYYEFFQQLNLIISKCDFFRMVVIYYLGGIYSDLDFYCMGSLNSLLAQQDILIFEEVPEHEPNGKQLTNAFLAAVPLHPFIGGWIEHMVQTLSLLPSIGIHSVMPTTGPVAFWRYYESVQNKPPLSNTCEVMPFTDRQLRSKICPSRQSTTHTIWNEGSGWGDGASFAWTGGIIVIIVVIVAGMIISRIINS